ncbi:Terminase-like family [uncultured Caudovirales phage]|uniref:Terminase-like family n=1 Tax=uncultured Caudovirales phage TaxID=2100421 RepID=A0A6J5N770_9CAUD|nr:Terminase-like family [uncultured Caudovirales phage]
MALSEAQKSIALDTRRFRVAVCGRRFGKTHLALRELCRYAAVPDRLVYYVAPTYRMAKQIMWKQLKKRLLELNWARKINESDLTVTLVNDSEISLRSSDNYDSLRGVGLDFIVLDEAADMAEEVWTEVLRPTLSDRGGHAMFLGTPKGMNWLKDVYDMSSLDPDNWAAYQFTTIDGGNVPVAEVEAARRDLDDRTFRQEYMASFETYSGLCYYAYSAGNVADTAELQSNDVIMIGLDFNVDPLSAVIAIRRGEHLHIIDEIVINGANTFEFCEEVRRRYPGRRIEIYPDASGAQRRTSSNTTDHAILANAQFTVRVGRINPAVLDRIAAVNSRLCSSTSQQFITINKRCKHLIKSLTSQVYKEGTRIPEKTGFDHMNDALGYLVNWHWPIRREMDIKDQPTYWSKY